MKLPRFISSAATLLAVIAFPAVALADKIVLLPPVTDKPSDEALIQPVRAVLETVITHIGHANASPSEEITAEVVSRGRSQDLREVLQQAARVASAEWAISARVDGRVTGYRIEIEACQANSGRVESVAREVESSRAEVQIEEMLRLLLRPEGIANADLPWEHPFAASPPAPAPTAPPPRRQPRRRRRQLLHLHPRHLHPRSPCTLTPRRHPTPRALGSDF